MSRVGRPRNAGVDELVIVGASEVLADDGFDRFSVEAVAARSGVAKSTIYRRFPSREALLGAVLERLNEDFDPGPDGMLLRARLIRLLSQVRSAPATTSGRILMQAAAEGLRTPEVAALVHARVLRPRHEAIRRIIQEAMARGEIRDDVDMSVVVPVLVGPALHLGMWNMCEGVDGIELDAVVDVILSGMTPASDS